MLRYGYANLKTFCEYNEIMIDKRDFSAYNKSRDFPTFRYCIFSGGVYYVSSYFY